VYECRQESSNGDELIAIFLHDNFARPNKQGGAWMSAYRTQARHTDGTRIVPVVVNNNNFSKAAPGEQALLSFDDATTLFHEFGHGLHGMLSDVAYHRLAGTNVLQDFVELPSQLYEHWLAEEEVLKRHARHVDTGVPIPDELIARMKAAQTFNQGFDTVEYTVSALLDQALHTAPNVADVDIPAFEAAELERLGLPKGIVPRHRPPHFLHLFAGDSYAAQYYVYLWAEVLDADGFDAFKEAGDIFDPSVAQRLRTHVYSAGNSVEPGVTYRAFRGRDPVVEPMLKGRGLVTV